MLAEGGLKVHTTLDLALQEEAERLVLEDGLVPLRGEDKGEAALVAIDPNSGGVRVLVGGREYANSPFNRAVLARRAAGSAFKPFVYLAALEAQVVTPSTLIQDEAQTFEVPEGEEKTYTPLNYTRKYKGTVTLRDCLVESLNVPTVKVAEMVGVPKIIEMSRKLGITSRLPDALSVALGSCETTPLEMAVAYATVAAGGLLQAAPHHQGARPRRRGGVPAQGRAPPGGDAGGDGVAARDAARRRLARHGPSRGGRLERGERRGEDGHKRRLPRRVVRGVHAVAGVRGVGGPGRKHVAARDGRRGRGAALGALHASRRRRRPGGGGAREASAGGDGNGGGDILLLLFELV